MQDTDLYIERVMRDYDGDHDLGADAPVNYYTYTNTMAIKALLKKVNELEQLVDELKSKLEANSCTHNQ